MKQKTTDTTRNCRYCNEHILATTQVVWKGYNYHELCLAKAIQESHQPPIEHLEQQRAEQEYIEDDYDYDDYYPEYDQDFTGDASDDDESEKDNGHASAEPEVLPPAPMVHVEQVANRVVQTVASSNGAPAIEPPPVGRLIAHCGAKRITREELATLPLPEATATFKPIGHASLVDQIMDSLWYRRMTVVRDEYAVSPDGMKLFGLIELDIEYKGVRFAIGIRNANDRSMRVAMVAGYKVTVCDNMMLQGDFQPLLAKHSKHFALEDALSIACDRVQRNFGKLHGEIERKQETKIEASLARELLYTAFTEGKFPISLMKTVHKEFFVAPSFDEFKPRTLWSLENALTTNFKKLEPVSQFQYTARLGKFLAPYLNN